MLNRANAIGLLCFSIAMWNYVQHRDISANMFLAAFLAIQGCRNMPDEKPSRQWDHVNLLCIILAVATLLFAAHGYFGDLQWNRPKSW